MKKAELDGWMFVQIDSLPKDKCQFAMKGNDWAAFIQRIAKDLEADSQ